MFKAAAYGFFDSHAKVTRSMTNVNNFVRYCMGEFDNELIRNNGNLIFGIAAPPVNECADCIDLLFVELNIVPDRDAHCVNFIRKELIKYVWARP